MRRAVERGEIEVHYQPIARLGDMDLAGFEVLRRWRHRTLVLLGPERFVRVAEQTGLIKDLGRHVLIEAGSPAWDSAAYLPVQAAAFRFRERFFEPQLVGSTLVEDVQSVFGSRQVITRDTFKIEVTELIVMEIPELAAQILDRLKQLGVGLSCDDFGNGYLRCQTCGGCLSTP